MENTGYINSDYYFICNTLVDRSSPFAITTVFIQWYTLYPVI